MRNFFFSVALLLFGQVCALEVELQAKSAILMNAKTGAVLYEKDARAKIFPASTTKIATALFILDEKQLDLSSVVKVSAEALRRKPNGATEPASWITTDSTVMGLAKGDRVDIEGLLHGLLMSSGNDAANVLAEATSGSISRFMEELNAYVRKIGCVDTSFLNPHGYHHPEHISTAYELSLLTKKALEIPKFREIIGKQVYRTAQKPDVELRQRNKLMKPGEHYYPKAIGGKTGFHSMAQNNLVAAAIDQDRTLIAVVLGCPKSDDRYRDAKVLFEAAFAEEKIESILVSREQVYTKNIEGAKRPLAASVVNPLAISFYPAETPKVKGFVYWDELSLPIRMGQKVGEIKVIDEQGMELGRQELFAQGSVDPTFFFSLKRYWKRLFGSIPLTLDLLGET